MSRLFKKNNTTFPNFDCVAVPLHCSLEDAVYFSSRVIILSWPIICCLSFCPQFWAMIARLYEPQELSHGDFSLQNDQQVVAYAHFIVFFRSVLSCTDMQLFFSLKQRMKKIWGVSLEDEHLPDGSKFSFSLEWGRWSQTFYLTCGLSSSHCYLYKRFAYPLPTVAEWNDSEHSAEELHERKGVK